MKENKVRQLATNLWVHERRVLGIDSGLRMTIVKLDNGRLWVHSPTPLSPELQAQVDAVGTVAWLVEANNHHHMSLLQWRAAYPTSRVHVSPGIPHKLPGLRDYAVLDANSKQPWGAQLTPAFMGGVPFFSETVFLHAASRSLIVTDFVQNHVAKATDSWGGKVVSQLFAAVGFKGTCLAPPLRLRFLRKDPVAFRQFLATLDSWDFDRIVTSHGSIVDMDAKQTLQQLCARYRETSVTP